MNEMLYTSEACDFHRINWIDELSKGFEAGDVEGKEK